MSRTEVTSNRFLNNDSCKKERNLSRAGVAEWYTTLCSPHRWSWVRAPNLHQCLWICLQVCGSKRLGCHADLCTVSWHYTRGESWDYTSEKSNKGSTLVWTPKQTSPEVQNRGISGPTKRTYVLQNLQKKERNLGNLTSYAIVSSAELPHYPHAVKLLLKC